MVVRWNSRTKAIAAALDIKPALEELVEIDEYRLAKWAIEEDEWDLLEDLIRVLEVSTLIISLTILTYV